MKQFLLLIFFPVLFGARNNRLYSQTSGKAITNMLRIYEDNDFINILGKGTDEAYTNGTRIEFLYVENNKSRFLLDRIFPKAGDSSINIFGVTVTQLMFTPRDISTTKYQPGDYPYSGALFISRILYSYNPVKKYSLNTELVLGIRGPGAFAEQTQTFIHSLINYQRPMGWQNQLENKLILNLNVASEKQLFSYKNSFDIIGGAEIFTGTFFNSAVLYPLVRIGKMNPYFNGLISQYSASTSRKQNRQLYFILKPELIFTATNALLESGKKQNISKEENSNINTKIEKFVYALNAGAVLTIKRFSISINQNITSTMIEHLYKHEVGNISFYFSW